MTWMKIWEIYEMYGKDAWIEATVMSVGDSIDLRKDVYKRQILWYPQYWYK